MLGEATFIGFPQSCNEVGPAPRFRSARAPCPVLSEVLPDSGFTLKPGSSSLPCPEVSEVAVGEVLSRGCPILLTASFRTRITAARTSLESRKSCSWATLRTAWHSKLGGDQLLAAVQAYGSEVVIIDTVSRVIDGEESSNDTWLNVYRHTGLKLKVAGRAMIRLDHSGKDEARGQRGGSAKAGDVDAIWRLSSSYGNRFRLDCASRQYQRPRTAHDSSQARTDHPRLDRRAADRTRNPEDTSDE